MFEGKTLMSYFEVGHLLSEKHSVTLTEYNSMLPWHIDVKLSLMRRDQEIRQQQMAQNSNPFAV